MTEITAHHYPAARQGTEEDAIDTLVPREIVAPRSPQELTDILRYATEHRQAMAVLGNRSKIEWGHAPERLDLGVETGSLTRILQHDASDLVVRVSANVTLEELQAELRTKDQRLAIDTMVPDTTIGGLIATGISGPLRYGFGAVRDLLIGITVIRADGVLASSGGRVVKNVAGYDLAKLYNGSYGTLGVITEAFFRLHAMPQRRVYLLGNLALTDAKAVVAELVRSQAAPSAIEIFFDSEATEVTLGILIEGMGMGIDTRAVSVATQMKTSVQQRDDAPPWWGTLPGTTTFKLTTEIASVIPLLESLRRISLDANQRLTVTGSAGMGVLFVGADIAIDTPSELVDALSRKIRDAAMACGGSSVVLRAPTPIRASLDVWGPVPAIDIMRRIKAQFDPYNLLAPGRFVGGI